MQQVAPVKIDVPCDAYMTRHYIFENFGAANTTPPEVWGAGGEGIFIFRELGSTAN